MKIDDVDKTSEAFYALISRIEKQVMKLKYPIFAFIDFVLAQWVKRVKKSRELHRETNEEYAKEFPVAYEREYKRKVMDRMDRDNKKDKTGADYRGYKGNWQIVARCVRKVSAFIEDNMFFTGFFVGAGVDGCGNMHRFLIDPNRQGIFTDENYNEDAIIWRIMDDQNLNLNGLNLLDNLRALHAELEREIVAETGHQLIYERLINRRDEVERRIAAAERAAALAELAAIREASVDDRASYIMRLGFERFRILTNTRYIFEVFQLPDRPAIVARANQLMANPEIPMNERVNLQYTLVTAGLNEVTDPAAAPPAAQ
jgi:hypothetical protein